MSTASLGPVVRHLRHLRRLAVPRDSSAGDGELLERFVARRDQSAFAAIVQRHGPMVLGVCRRLLPRVQDAEDAFQVTFLVLVRRASAVDVRRSLAGWLCGVAYRTACSVRRRERVRATESGSVELLEQEAPNHEAALRELQQILDEELNRLPAKHREPLVLVYLEGQTHEEAAQRLGWPAGSMSRRLERGRELLRARLVRRGVSLSAALLISVLSATSASAAVPASLLAATVQAALLLAAGKAAHAGAVAAPILALVQGVLRTMFLQKLKITLALLMLAGVVLTGLALVAHRSFAGGQGQREQPEQAQAVGNQDKPKSDKELLQGTWKMESIDTADANENEEARKKLKEMNLRWTFTGDKLIMKAFDPTGQEQTYNGTYLLDPAAKPKAIDVTVKEGGKDSVMHAIYMLEGDTLTLCGIEAPGERPGEFKVKDSSKQMLVALKRQKPKPEGEKEKQARIDKQKLQGMWLLDQVEAAGGAGESEEQARAKAKAVKEMTIRWIFEGDVLLLKNREPQRGEVTRKAVYELDASKNPKTIDVDVPEEKGTSTMHGIYEFAGDDVLKICAVEPPAERPSDFQVKSGSKRVLFTLKRVRPVPVKPGE